MLFTEVVLQGVRCFGETHRFPLGTGFSAYVGGAGTGKSSLVDVLVHLLFPDGSEPATEAFRAASSPICRVALTIDDGRGQVYRLIKDLLRGSLALTRYDPQSQQFAPISSTPAEILQYLSATLHLPQRDVFEGVYVIRARDLPSAAAVASGGGVQELGDALGVGMPPGAARRGAPAPAAARRLPPSPHFSQGGDGGASHFPGYQGGQFDAGGFDAGGELLPDDPEEIRSQIGILQRDLAMVRTVDDLQFRLDGLQSELFELEQKSKGVREAEGRLARIEQGLDQFAHLANLPGDFEERVKAFRADKERYLRDLGRIEEERQRWEDKAQHSQPGPLKKNRNFLLGVGGGLAALIAGTAGFFVSEPLRWVALADFVFFGVALVAAIRHIDMAMGAERSQSRLALIDERRQKLERQFELESSIVRRTMEQVKAEAPEQVLEMYAKRTKLVAEIEAARHEVAKQRGQVGLADVEKRKAEVQADVDGIEAQLAGMSGMQMSMSDMERKLDLLRDKLAWIEGGGASGSTGGASEGFELGLGAPPGAMLGGGLASQAEPAAVATDAGVSGGVEVCRRLVGLGEDLFLVDAEKLNGLLAPRASQFLAALSAKTLGALEIHAKGDIRVVDAGSGGPLGLEALSAAQQDLVYLALKFAFIEGFSKQQPVPMFLDDPFKALNPGLQEMLSRFMAGLGRSTQVVLFTSQAALTQHATASFSL